MAQGVCTIGEGVLVNGRLTGDEEVTVHGRMEGAIHLGNHLLVAKEGVVVADVEANTLTVLGHLNGEVVVHDIVTLKSGSVVTGNIRTPRIIIEEGARFKGNVDMDVQAS